MHLPPRSFRAPLVALAILASAAAGASSLTGPLTSSPPTTVTFMALNRTQTWQVPPGTTSIRVDAQGARGNGPYGSGGLGGRVQATVPVIPGEILHLNVGSTTAVDGLGGSTFNGGGAGWWNNNGGGAADIRQGGNDPSKRIVVAGGGGGEANYPIGGQGPGGAGGAMLVRAGAEATCSTAGPGIAPVEPSGGREGGGYSVGDACGTGCDLSFSPAGANSGGNGGASYVEASATSVVHQAGWNAGNGRIIISYPPAPPQAALAGPGSAALRLSHGPHAWLVPARVTPLPGDGEDPAGSAPRRPSGDGDPGAVLVSAPNPPAGMPCTTRASGVTDLAGAVSAYFHDNPYVNPVPVQPPVPTQARASQSPRVTPAQLLANPNLLLQPPARQDLVDGVVAQPVLDFLAWAAGSHKIAVSVIKTGHSENVAGTGRVSLHFTGRAVDIAGIDGESVSPDSPAARGFAQAVAVMGRGRPTEVGQPWADLAPIPGFFSDANHLTHIHLGWWP